MTTIHLGGIDSDCKECVEVATPDTVEAFEEAIEGEGLNLEAFKIWLSNSHLTLEGLIEQGEDWQDYQRDFEESYQGEFGGWNPQKEFAEAYIDSSGILGDVPEFAQRYFDYEAFGRDLFMGDYWEEKGHVFASY